jgi:hypothetical protein
LIAHYRTKSNIGIGLGLVLQFGSVAMVTMLQHSAGRTMSVATLGLFVMIRLFAIALFIWGCCMYAKAKGRSAGLGAFGLLSLIGLIVLACLKDLCPDGQPQEVQGFDVLPLPGGQASGQAEVRPYF